MCIRYYYFSFLFHCVSLASCFVPQVPAQSEDVVVCAHFTGYPFLLFVELLVLPLLLLLELHVHKSCAAAAAPVTNEY